MGLKPSVHPEGDDGLVVSSVIRDCTPRLYHILATFITVYHLACRFCGTVCKSTGPYNLHGRRGPNYTRRPGLLVAMTCFIIGISATAFDRLIIACIDWRQFVKIGNRSSLSVYSPSVNLQGSVLGPKTCLKLTFHQSAVSVSVTVCAVYGIPTIRRFTYLCLLTTVWLGLQHCHLIRRPWILWYIHNHLPLNTDKSELHKSWRQPST